MKPILSVIFAIQFCHSFLYAQPTKISCKDSSYEIEYNVGNIVNLAFITTSDDGKLFASGGQDSAGVITKLTVTGSVEWSKRIRLTNSGELQQIQRLLQLKSGEIMVAGVVGGVNYAFFYLMKFNSDGSLLWQYKYVKNGHQSSSNGTQTFIDLVEGQNGETVGFMNESDAGYDLTKITRFDANGNIVWSNGYKGGDLLLTGYSNVYDNGVLNLWGQTQSKNSHCFSAINFGLALLRLNYNNGLQSDYKAFCGQSPLPSPMSVNLVGVSDHQNFCLTKQLPNKNIVNITTVNPGLLINLFDANMNWIKSRLFAPPPSSLGASYNFDISSEGEVAFSIQEVTAVSPYSLYLPYLPLILLDAELNYKRAFKITIPGYGDAVVHVYNPLAFTPSGNISFTEYSNPIKNSTTIVTMPVNVQASAICYTTDTVHGTLSNYTLQANDDVFKWDSVVTNYYRQDGQMNLMVTDVAVTQKPGCNTVSVCDSIKIHGNEIICLSNDTVVFTSFRNSQCKRTINWQIDSSMINNITKANDTTVHINFKKAGTVWLYALVNNCVVKDSLKIIVRTPAKNLSINKDSLLCPGKNILLQATPGFAEYKWQDGSTLDKFTVTKAGFYKLVATDSCGTVFTDSVTIQMIDTTFALASPKIICIGDTATITLPTLAGNVSWQPFDNAVLSDSVLYLYPLQTTSYSIRAVKNPDCFIESEIKIIVNNCPETIFFPNSFTPNNNRLNDVFKPTVSLPLKSYNLSIYNRYGQLVFTTSNPGTGWNGSYNQEQQKSGNYIYKCTYQFKNGVMKFKKGNCLLLR